jgi:hypothetical protein
LITELDDVATIQYRTPAINAGWDENDTSTLARSLLPMTRERLVRDGGPEGFPPASVRTAMVIESVVSPVFRRRKVTSVRRYEAEARNDWATLWLEYTWKLFVPLITVFESYARSPKAAAGALRSGRRAAPAKRTTKVTARGEVGRRRLTLEPQMLIVPPPG